MNKKMGKIKKIYLSKKPGFSMMEVILSAFILSMGIVAIFTLLAKSTKDSIDSRDQIIAAELAQEGVELVRNVRDNNMAIIKKGDSSIGVFQYFPNDKDCATDVSYSYSDGEDIIDCTVSSGSFALKYNNSSKFYQRTGDDTKFSRKIKIEDKSYGKKITSIVIWNGSTFPSDSDCNSVHHCIAVEDILTDRTP